MKKYAFTKPSVKIHLASAAVLALLAASVTGCGAGSAAASFRSKSVPAEMITETTAAAMDTALFADSGAGGYIAETAAAPMMEGEFQVAQTTSALTSSNPIQPTSTSRKLIRNVDLNVETTDFDQLISDISQSVTDAGGYMEQSDISGSSISGGAGRRYAYFTARVPSDKLDSFVTLVGEQGNITNKSEYTQDVTLQYSDIESRKKSLTIEQERLWELLEKADTLEAVIALEERLSEIRYQLESFESQLRTYDNRVDYSTVSISVNEVQVLTPTTPDTIGDRIAKGFRRNLETVSRTAVNLTVWFLSSLPTLVILAVIVVILAAIVKRLRLAPGKGNILTKRRRKQKGAADGAMQTERDTLAENNKDKTE